MKKIIKTEEPNYKKIVTYDDLISVLEYENNEELVPLNDLVLCAYMWLDMVSITGEKMYVRKSVAKRIVLVQKKLQMQYPERRLKIFYGYRHPAIQEKYFLETKNKLKAQYKNSTSEELDRIVHRYIAVPAVAGHPTGGAVDVTIVTNDGEIEMGVGAEDFSDPNKLETFSTGVSIAAQRNRLLLHDLMIEQGFAPFYGEWWHFSFGDREWAYFYNQPTSLYTAVEFKVP